MMTERAFKLAHSNVELGEINRQADIQTMKEHIGNRK